jgi:hypothetical protein
MNGNPRVLASPGDRSGAPTVIGAGCVHFFFLPGKGKRRTIALSRRAPGECPVKTVPRATRPLAPGTIAGRESENQGDDE